MDKKKTGQLIKDARIKKCYTQKELGDLLGVSNKAVSRWETGESFPDVGVIEALSQILEIKIRDIITGESSADEEETLTETIRLAKMQRRAYIKKPVIYGLLMLLLFCCWICGYTELVNLHASDRNIFFLPLMLLFFLPLPLLDSSPEMGELCPDNKFSRCCCGIAVLSLIWVLSVSWIFLENAVQGAGFAGMSLTRVGLFINNQLAAAFFLNLILISTELYRREGVREGLHLGWYISLTVMLLSILYGNYLHNMSLPETVFQELLCRTAMGFCTLAAALILRQCIKKSRPA